MATATAIEIKRAADAADTARTLREINDRLARIEAALKLPVAPAKGRTVPHVAAVQE